MNTQQTFTSKPGTRRMLLVWMTLLMFSSSLVAQENLRALVQGAGTEWMVGKWTGTNSQGEAVTLEYEWELDGCALEIDLQIGGISYKGMIFRHPVSGEVFESGADTAGGVTRAIWREEAGLIISERTGTRPGGREVRVAVTNKRIDANRFTATLHPLSAEGVIGETVLDTVDLKRLPPDEAAD